MAPIQSLYREVRDLTGYVVGERAMRALQQARLVQQAEAIGLEVTWEHEQDSAMYDYGNVGDWISEKAWNEGLNSGRFDVLYAYVKDARGNILASLGGIIVDARLGMKSERDYRRGHELDLLAEAMHTLKTTGA